MIAATAREDNAAIHDFAGCRCLASYLHNISASGHIRMETALVSKKLFGLLCF